MPLGAHMAIVAEATGAAEAAGAGGGSRLNRRDVKTNDISFFAWSFLVTILHRCIEFFSYLQAP